MNNEKDPMQFANIEPDLDYFYCSFYNIIYQNHIKVQRKWKKYYKKDLYARYNHRIPEYNPTWKKYSVEKLLDKIPSEIENIKAIVPPDDYHVTSKTKIKYLKDFPDYNTNVIKFLTRIDESEKFINNAIYLIDYFRENADDDGITGFWEDNFERFDGDPIVIFGYFTNQVPLIVEKLKDKYFSMLMEESGEI